MKISGIATGIVAGSIGLVVAVTLAANLLPTIADSGNDLNATGYPLTSLFASDGIFPLIVVAGILVGCVGMAFAMTKSK